MNWHKHHPLAWQIFFIAVLSVGATVAWWGGDIYNTYSQAIDAKLQANLLSLQKNYVNRSDQQARVVLVGDIMLGRSVASKIEQKGEATWPFNEVADYLAQADLTFGNLEGPISTRGKKQGGPYSFVFKPQVIEGLKLAGFDVLSIANNHIMDYGGEALSDTKNLLGLNSIKTVGAGGNRIEANSPVVTKVRGNNIIWLAFTTLYPKGLEATETGAGVSVTAEKDIVAKVKEVRDEYPEGVLITSLHWGEEYTEPTEAQIRLGQTLIEAGVDLVVGSHPHVVQRVEKYNGGWIAYSLGNFIFDQGFSKETMRGLLLEATIKDNKITSINSLPTKISKDWQASIIK